MPSYAYGMTKYVDSPQGKMDLGQLSGSVYVPIVPNTFYNFKNLQWYIDNGYFYYASDYPNPLDDTEGRGKFPKIFEIGTIKGTTLYGAFYWNDTNVPSGTPPLIATPNIRLFLMCGDCNGTVSERNPLGLRIGASHQIPWVDISRFYINTELQTTTYSFPNKPYGFFGNTDINNNLNFFSIVLIFICSAWYRHYQIFIF